MAVDSQCAYILQYILYSNYTHNTLQKLTSSLQSLVANGEVTTMIHCADREKRANLNSFRMKGRT